MSLGTLVAVAESTDDVLAAGRKLQAGRSDPDSADYAANLLANRLEESLASFGSARTQGFDSDGSRMGEESAEDALAIAASQLSMATVALAAGAPDGASDIDLDAALADLATTSDGLKQLVAPATAQGFDTGRVASVDLTAAISGLRAATQATVDGIATTGAQLCERVLQSLPEMLPFLKNTWDSITGMLKLEGLGDHVSRLVRLALRLVAAALDRLANLIPSALVPAARDRVQALATRLDGQGPAVAIFSSAFDVDGILRDVSVRLGRDGLDKSKLDRATGSLGALSEQYGRYMGTASRVANGLKLLHQSSGLLAPFVPQIAVATTGAHVVLLVAVVAISVDFLDTGTTVGAVRGVRITITDATE